jgi:hypothetical protein
MQNTINIDDSGNHHYSFFDEQPEDTIPNSSLIDSILSLMTPEQREDFIESVSSIDVIYANRTPSCNNQLSLQLTNKAYNQLIEILQTTGARGKTQSDDFLDLLSSLKTDLEAGICLSFKIDHSPKEKYKKMLLKVQSRLFDITCKFTPSRNTNQWILLAIDLKPGKALKNRTNVLPKQYAEKTEEPEFKEYEDVNDLYEEPQSNPPKETYAKRTKPDRFVPDVQTSWEIRAPNQGEAPHIDADAIERLVSEISNNREISEILRHADWHLRDLEKIVRTVQVAFRYRYTLHDCIKSSDVDYYRLKVEGPKEVIDKMQQVYVYPVVEFEDEITHALNQTSDDTESTNRHRKKPLVLKGVGSEGNFHRFTIEKGDSIPPRGLLADIGLESQIEKELDAMQVVATPKNMLHLMKLASLLGRIDTSKLESYSWSEDNIAFIDKQLTEQQQEAVKKALSTPDICLIQGPPGTGKTLVISEIVQQAAKRGWKTLLAAPTHVAVDNVLENIGLKDDVSPIRCVREEKLSDLSDYIRQFTYKERVELLPNHAMNLVRQDIEQLNKEKLKIKLASKILRELSSAEADLRKLQNSEQSLKDSMLQLPQVVRQEFNNKIKDTNATKDQADKLYSETENRFKTVQKSLKNIRTRAKQVKSESYSSKDVKRFKEAEANVDKIHGKALRKIKTFRDAAARKVASTEQAIKLTQVEHNEAQQIVSEIDAGRIPLKVQTAIQQKVEQVGAEHDRYVAAKDGAVEQAKNQLCSHIHQIETLKVLFASTKDTHNKLQKLKDNSWWKRPWHFVWWESFFIDYEKRELKYSGDLQTFLRLLPTLQDDVPEAELAAAEARCAKQSAVDFAKSSELEHQHKFYKSRCRFLASELDRIGQQLTDEKSQLETLNQNEYSAHEAFKSAMQKATETVKSEIRNETTLDVKNVRREVRLCKVDLGTVGEVVEQAQKAILQLEELIEQTTEQRRNQFEIQIKQIQADITTKKSQIKSLEKEIEDLLNQPTPRKPAEIEKAINNLDSKLSEQEDLKAFLASWLGYLERESEVLGNRLATYINLVCATTVGIASDEYFGNGRPLEQKQFDLLIIDEAGKVTEPEFLVAATRAKRWILFGDHKQLPPYYDQRLDPAFEVFNKACKKKGTRILDSTPLRISFFENLWNQLNAIKPEKPNSSESRCITLNIQWRMHPDLATFISDVFYDKTYLSPSK